MHRSLKTALTSLLGISIATSLTAVPATAAGLYRISQESAAGRDDFDDNILGFIDPFNTSGTIADFYNYGKSDKPYFRGPVSLSSDTSHLFLVQASNGLGLFSVHDQQGDGSGGTADMKFDLIGDTASFLVKDDPASSADKYITNDNRTFTTNNLWGKGPTDGVAIGSLDGEWTMFSQFTALGSNAGGELTSWKALSGTGSSLSLALNTGQRVRIDRAPDIADPPVTDVPEPTIVVGLLAVAMGGSIVKRRDRVAAPQESRVS